MSLAQPRPATTRLMAESARKTTNLVALGSSIALACAVANVWLVVMGTWLYALLIARDAASQRFRRKVAELDAELARQLPSESSLTDPALMLIVQTLRKGFTKITRLLKETPETVQPHLRSAAASLEDVRAQAAQLVRDADSLSRYLLTLPAEATQTAICKLNQEIAQSSDDAVKAEFQRTLAVRQDQLAAIAQVAREHERIVAALQLIVGTVDAFPAWIYRMRVLEARAKGDRVGDLNDGLVDMKTELATSQQLLEALASPRASSDEAAGDHRHKAPPLLEWNADEHHRHDG